MEACYSQDKYNVTTYNVLAISLISLQTFAGMWINAFVFSVLCIAWVRKKSSNSNEKILVFLGCTRFWYLCFAWVSSIIENIYPWCIYVRPVPQVVLAFQTFFNCSSLWVSAFRSVFYCTKIANFQHSFFIHLKVKIDRIVPWVLLGSLLLSLGMGILLYKVIDEAVCDNINCTSTGNVWKLNINVHQHFLPVYFLHGFAYAIAFTAVISSALLLLFSLWRHKHKMQMKSLKNVSMDAHIKAMKSILSFLFLYIINFIGLVFNLIYLTKKGNALSLLTVVLQDTSPTVYCLILIFSNPKLKKALLRTLSCVKCKICMRQEMS
ncbi:PREDICTED: taste receptor type 2 member 9-like [Chaetura pelagica]|uniref:taste receptor type 2 member 9-like n=1 Tax=Chaetura pelagica TaxID=8897 RepID=UPI000523667A|nr:PREDICTED: taste receptor type 2 member 9-like [Chaetura pelagica]